MSVIKGKKGCSALSDSFIAAGSVTMDTAGGVQVITNSAINADDVAVTAIISDDTGETITLLTAVCTANTLTITRNDTVSSADDAVVSYLVMRTV